MKNLSITLFIFILAFVFLHASQTFAITGCTGTCIYSTAGHCDCGTGDSGFNPPSCGFSYGPVSCPAVQSITAHVETTTGAPVPGVPVHFNDNGRGGTVTTDGNGNAPSQVWEDDSMQITPGLSGSITGFSPAGMSFTFDGTGSCPGNTCTFTASFPAPPTNIPPTNTPIPAPTNTPSPTIPPIVSLSLVLGLPGIGYNGPTGISPKHMKRSVTVQLYDASVINPSGPGTAPLATGKGTVTFDSGSDSNAGYFVGTITNISLPTTPPANNQYKILVQVPQYLYQLAVVTPPPSDNSQANIFTLTGGQSVTAAPFSLLPGDIYTANGGINHLTVDDYTQILACFNNVSDPTCTKTPGGILYADLDDNGVVDIVDMNLWLRSLSQLTQAQAPGCSTGDCQGD